MSISETEIETRGIENPKVVDLIYPDMERDQVVLRLVETRPWNLGPEQISQLEEKFNNYLDYVLDGWMARQYPQYAGKRVRIQLICQAMPSGLVKRMLDEFQSYLATQDFDFEVRVGPELPPGD